MIPDKTRDNLWKKKIVEPLKGFLAQGLSSKRLSFTIALGIVLGTFPVLGTTTILCLLAALFLRLNLPVIQFANYLLYPLQIVLLVPYYYLGTVIFSGPQPMSFDTLKDMLTAMTDRETLTMIFDSTLNAIGAWLLISPFVLVLLYAALKPVLVRMNTRSSRLRLMRR